MRILAILLPAALGTLGTAVTAQEVCDSILKYGVFEETELDKSSIQVEQLIKSYCKMTDEQLSSSSSSGVNLSVVKDSIEGMFSSARASMSDSSFRSHVCNEGSAYSFRQEETRDVIRTASKVIVNAWSACMNRQGLNFSVKVTPDHSSAILHGRLNAGEQVFSKDIRLSHSPEDAFGGCKLGSEYLRNPNAREFSITCPIEVTNKDIALTLSDASSSPISVIIQKKSPHRVRDCSTPLDYSDKFAISDDSNGWVHWGGQVFAMGNEDECKLPSAVKAKVELTAGMQRSHDFDFMRCDIKMQYGANACDLVAGNTEWLQRLHDQSPTMNGNGTLEFLCSTSGKRASLQLSAKVHNATCDIAYSASFLSAPK